jgi:hypothetical protein
VPSAPNLEVLAAWTADTSKRRPQPTVPALKAVREESVAEAEALGLRLTEILAEKERFVEKHRGRLVKDADEATAQARERCEQLIAQLRQARQELIEIREASIWAQLFPRAERRTGSPPLRSWLACARRPPICSSSRRNWPRTRSSGRSRPTRKS